MGQPAVSTVAFELLERSPAAFIAIDGEGRIAYRNSAASDLIRELTGRTIRAGGAFAALLPDGLTLDDCEPVARALGGSAAAGELILQAPDGDFERLHAWSWPLPGADEPLAGVILMPLPEPAHDAAEERDRLLEQKRESLERLAQGLAHALGNDLTVIIGNAMLLSDDVVSDTARTLANEISEGSWRVNALVHRLGSFASRNRLAADLAAVDLNEVAEEAIAEAVAETPDVAIRAALAPGLPPIPGDAERLRACVREAIANAIEAGAATITIRTGQEIHLPRGRGTRVVPAAMPEGTTVTIEVADDGPGMEEDSLERAFDPFFSTRHRARGLGLPDIYAAARAHGGVVHLRSTPGAGTAVALVLPVDPRDTDL